MPLTWLTPLFPSQTDVWVQPCPWPFPLPLPHAFTHNKFFHSLRGQAACQPHIQVPSKQKLTVETGLTAAEQNLTCIQHQPFSSQIGATVLHTLGREWIVDKPEGLQLNDLGIYLTQGEPWSEPSLLHGFQQDEINYSNFEYSCPWTLSLTLDYWT